MRTGLDPVGRPSTKGCSAVGLKCVILSLKTVSETIHYRGVGGEIPMMYLAIYDEAAAGSSLIISLMFA